MISFIPDRIGHATYLNSELKNMVLQSKIPLGFFFFLFSFDIILFILIFF